MGRSQQHCDDSPNAEDAGIKLHPRSRFMHYRRMFVNEELLYGFFLPTSYIICVKDTSNDKVSNQWLLTELNACNPPVTSFLLTSRFTSSPPHTLPDHPASSMACILCTSHQPLKASVCLGRCLWNGDWRQQSGTQVRGEQEAHKKWMSCGLHVSHGVPLNMLHMASPPFCTSAIAKCLNIMPPQHKVTTLAAPFQCWFLKVAAPP
jgi:hypothetical protein